MGRRLIIYDIKNFSYPGRTGDILFSANPIAEPCKGCFNCWVKTPGKCVINDRCSHIPSEIAMCDEMVLISPILYGGYSENIKAVIDRSIPYVLPYFRILKGEMHHKMRYSNPFKLTACFYGICDEEEKQIAENLVKANSLNFGAKSYEVKFFDELDQLRSEVL
ncbi:MAG: flavodoxin family protein [Clostridia bacterium]